MAYWCQLAPCHVIVVKWGCNNHSNMLLIQFEPPLRHSFYLRGGGGRIYDSLCVSVLDSIWVSLSFQPCLSQTRCLWKGVSYLHPDVIFGCREKAPKIVCENQRGYRTPNLPSTAARAVSCLSCEWL